MKKLLIIASLLVFINTCRSAARDNTPLSTTNITPTETTFTATQILETPIPTATLQMKTLEAIPRFTPLPGPCATPLPNEFDEFIEQSITIQDNGKTFVSRPGSRFWIYLDDRVYPLDELLRTLPDGLIGYVSNGSIRGPLCYPIMFETVREGKGLLQIKDFQLWIVIDNNAPLATFPLH